MWKTGLQVAYFTDMYSLVHMYHCMKGACSLFVNSSSNRDFMLHFSFFCIVEQMNLAGKKSTCCYVAPGDTSAVF